MIFIKRLLFKNTIIFALCVLLAFSPISVFASSTSSTIAETEKTDDVGKAEIFEASLSELRDMLESGKLTSEKLCEVYIERINTFDKKGDKLNSVISINKNALAQAKQLDSERKAGVVKGLLHGIPILVKDSIDVSDFPTTLGKTSLSDEIKDTDASAVAFLVGQGAIILGKTNLSTDDASTRYTVSQILGETRNAYNVKYAAGGSSGGCAVAVSANFAAAALATDTNSSAKYPAALNGVVAFRPTHGHIDYSGCESVVKARDTVSPITKSVEDAALLLDIMTDNAQTTPYLKSLNKNALKGKKIAVLKELSRYTYNSPNEWKKSDDEISSLFETAQEDLKAQGAEIVEISIPKLFTYYYTCRESMSGSANAKANLLSQIKSQLSQSGADAIIYPSYLSTPLKSGFDEYGSHKAEGELLLNCGSYLPSLVGLPAAVVPMGYTKDGVGAGLEFVSLQNTDKELLSIAYAYECASNKRVAPKTAPNLYEVIEVPELENDKVDSVVSDVTVAPAVPKEPGFDWQKLAVVIIVVCSLAFCVWILVFGYKSDKRKSTHRNRHF